MAARRIRTAASAPHAGEVRRTDLPGGLRVITETMPGVRSVAFGLWVKVGSRDETGSLAGSTHFLEHLLFKGTRKRDALAISAALDAVGGELNAFTTKEYTCYYARVLDADLPLAVDVICDMVTDSRIASSDVESERGVILEEIAMHDDDPSDVVHEAFSRAAYGGHALGRPVLGTVESISSVSRNAVAGYWRRRYRPDQMVVAVAGNLEHERVVALVQEAFAGVTAAPDATPAGPRGRSGRGPGFLSGIEVVRRPSEQANVVLGTAGVSRFDERRYALGVLNSALGGGMSSRLFQEVREKRGLAYSVYSYSAQYADTGTLGIYAGCTPARVDEVLKLCRAELESLAADGLTPEELARGKGQLRGGLVLGLEDTSSRMSRLGKGELTQGEIVPVDDVLRRIDDVTDEQVRELAADLLRTPLALAVTGPFEEDRDFASAVA